MANILEKPQAERWKAVLLTAKANDRLEGDPKGARDDAMAALKLAKDLVPAAVIAAKAWLREDNIRKAASTLEGVWKLGPHPEIARAYIRARSGDSTIDRLKRAEKLEAMRPNNLESLLAVAQAALDAQEFKKARAKAEAAARMEPREAVYLLLADIEEAETGDQGRVRHWMAQALRAPRDPALGGRWFRLGKVAAAFPRHRPDRRLRMEGAVRPARRSGRGRFAGGRHGDRQLAACQRSAVGQQGVSRAKGRPGGRGEGRRSSEADSRPDQARPAGGQARSPGGQAAPQGIGCCSKNTSLRECDAENRKNP